MNVKGMTMNKKGNARHCCPTKPPFQIDAIASLMSTPFRIFTTNRTNRVHFDRTRSEHHMSQVFILGAGFSKAISSQMPLTRELTEEVFNRFKQEAEIPKDVRAMLRDDFEKGLTYLANENPWLRESENLRNRALYLDLTHFIRAVIDERSRGPTVWRTNSPPMWLEALITHWHKNRCAVITLNYDTLIERVAGSGYWPSRTRKFPLDNCIQLI